MSLSGKNSIKTFFNKKNTLNILTIAFLLLMLPVGISLTRRAQIFFSNADENTAKLYVLPSKVELPPDTLIKLMVDSKSNKIGFVRAELSFDPNQIIINGDIQVSEKFKTVIEKTSREEANSKGKIILVLGVSATDRDFAPSGVFEVASIPIGSKTSTENVQTVVSINQQNSQIVSMGSLNLFIEAKNSDLIVNPVSLVPLAPELTATITSTSTPTPTLATGLQAITSTPLPGQGVGATIALLPSDITTFTPTPTNTNTLTPTRMPIVTNTPKFTNTPTPTNTPSPRPTNTATPTPLSTLTPTPAITSQPSLTLVPLSIPTSAPDESLKDVDLSPWLPGIALGPKTGNWNYPDKFVVKNTSKSPVSVKFSIDYWKDAEDLGYKDLTWTQTLSPGQIVEYGGGKICGKWSLILEVGKRTSGAVSEPDKESCSLLPTFTPTPVLTTAPTKPPVKCNWWRRLLRMCKNTN